MFHNEKGYLEGTVFLPDSCSVHCLIFLNVPIFQSGNMSWQMHAYSVQVLKSYLCSNDAFC